MRSRFRIVEHTADVGIAGEAPTLDALFSIMARGLFSLVGDLDTVRPRVTRRVHLEADSRERLLHAWLAEANDLSALHAEIYSGFTVRLDGLVLSGTLTGEAMNRSRHDLQHEVKAVTWHGLQVAELPGGFSGRVLLDI